MHQIDRNTGNLILCIGEAIIGILLLVNPVGFTSGIIRGLGVAMILLGARELAAYFKKTPEDAAAGSGMAKGLTFAVLGLFCLFRAEWFILTFPVLTVLYGILTLANGINKIQWAVDLYRLSQKYWYIEVIGAVLTVVFAVLILTNPFASTTILWTFIGISLIAEAVIDILAFVLGRK